MVFNTEIALKNTPFFDRTNIVSGSEYPNHVMEAIGYFTEEVNVAHFDCTPLSYIHSPFEESECHVKISLEHLVASVSPGPSLTFDRLFKASLSTSPSFADSTLEWEDNETSASDVEIYHEEPQLAHNVSLSPSLSFDRLFKANLSASPSFDDSTFDWEEELTSTPEVEVYHEDPQLAHKAELVSVNSSDNIASLFGDFNIDSCWALTFTHFFASLVDEDEESEDYDDADADDETPTTEVETEIHRDDPQLARKVKIASAHPYDPVAPPAADPVDITSSSTLAHPSPPMPKDERTTGFHMVRGWHAQPTLLNEPDVVDANHNSSESSSETSLYTHTHTLASTPPTRQSILGRFFTKIANILSRPPTPRRRASKRPEAAISSTTLSSQSSITVVVDDGSVEASDKVKQRRLTDWQRKEMIMERVWWL